MTCHGWSKFNVSRYLHLDLDGANLSQGSTLDLFFTTAIPIFLRQFKSHSKAHTLGVNQTNDIRSKWIFKQMHVKEDCQKLLSGFFPLMGYPNDPNEVSHIWKSATSFQNTNYLLKFVIYRSLLLGHPTP